jgi:hypothetical protein
MEVVNSDLRDELIRYLPNVIQYGYTTASLILSQSREGLPWEQISELIKAMEDIYTAFTADQQVWINSQSQKQLIHFKEAFSRFNHYMDSEEYIHASDTLQFELIPTLQALLSMLGEESVVRENRFQKNSTFIEHRFPRLYETIKGEERDRNRYCITHSYNQMPNMCIRTENKDDVYYYSQFEPEYEGSRWVESLQVNSGSDSTVLLFGFGFGTHLQAFTSKHPNHKVYLYEPDIQIFLAALEVIDLEDMIRNNNVVDIAVGEQKEQRDQFFYRLYRYLVGEPVFLALPIYNQLTYLDTKRIIEEAGDAISNYKSSILMSEKYGLDWARNSLLNMSRVLATPSIAELESQIEGMTAIIVGAGPSLDADIEWLKKMKEHSIIIAAGTSIQSLLHYGVRPHLIVSIDGSESNYRAFQAQPIEDIPLLFAPMIHYSILDRFPDKLVHMSLNNDHVSKFFLVGHDKDTIFKPNLSVTGVAIQAAIYMGCREVILFGQDFSYPTENVYAAGASHLETTLHEEIITNADQFVENVHGLPNRISWMMKLTLSDIEDLLGEYPDIAFLNTSRYGAKVKHTRFVLAEDVYSQRNHQFVDGDIFNRLLTQSKKNNDIKKADVYTRIMGLQDDYNLVDIKLRELMTYMMPLTTPLNRDRSDQEILAKVTGLWKDIAETPLFRGVYIKVYKSWIYEFERELKEIMLEEQYNKRLTRLLEAMKPMVEHMLNHHSPFQSIISDARERLKSI